ncbi:MAG TPA: hypothetical protein VJP88_10615, partial [Caulobacteraceae bacterium]|nr:hypothetical protein [Caulobacteraceae bacterium]
RVVAGIIAWLGVSARAARGMRRAEGDPALVSHTPARKRGAVGDRALRACKVREAPRLREMSAAGSLPHRA